MFQIIQTAYFEKWQENLKDIRAKAKIEVRIRRMETGVLGDIKPVGEGVSETRIHYALDTAFTSANRAKSSLFCFAEGMNPRKTGILKKQRS